MYVALLLAALLDPLARLLHRAIPAWAAALLSLLLLLAVVLGAAYLVASRVAGQISNLTTSLTTSVDQIRGWLGASRGVATSTERLLVTRGAQHALDLVARALVRPGDRIATEALGYAPAWRVFDLAGGVRVPLPVDGGGLRGILALGLLAEIEALLRQRHGGSPYFRLCHYFDLIAGTSTGAIIAAKFL